MAENQGARGGKDDHIVVGLQPHNVNEEVEYRRVLRTQLKINVINSIFGCNAFYLRDNFGNVIWPKDWQIQAMAPTRNEKWQYVIVEKDEAIPIDDAKDVHYKGPTVLLLTDVPDQCKEIDIRRWLLYGIGTDYEPINLATEELNKAKRKMAVLLQRADELPNTEVQGTKEQQIDIRRKLAEAVQTHKDLVTKEIQKAERMLANQRTLLAAESIRFNIVNQAGSLEVPEGFTPFTEISPKIQQAFSNWYVHFTGIRGEALADAVLEKTDWSSIRLAQTRPEPTLSLDEFPNDLSKDEVNLRGIRIHRVKHGAGMFVESNDLVFNDSFHVSSIRSMYLGTYHQGKKHGDNCWEINNTGMFKGPFLEGVRRGSKGSLTYGSGDLWEGGFNLITRQYKYGKYKGRDQPLSLLNGEDYCLGLECGQGVMRFADGATYEGEMLEGKITGHGRYVSSTGCVMEGMFLDGQLHGEGKIVEPNGRTLEGTFVLGNLHGLGKEISKTKNVYEGAFQMGVKHGRALMIYQDGTVHSGFRQDNLRHGRGFVDYGHAKRDEFYGISYGLKHVDCDFTYEGNFINSETTARHRNICHNPTILHHVPFTTHGKSKARLKYLIDLAIKEKKEEARYQTNFRRRYEREREHLMKVTQKNLSMYYDLLDKKYEAWEEEMKRKTREAGMTDEEQRALQAEREEAKNRQRIYEETRQLRYGIRTEHLVLDHFPTYIQRHSLTVLDELQDLHDQELIEASTWASSSTSTSTSTATQGT